MEFGVGSNYLDICDRAKGLWAEEASLCGVGIRSVISGESSEFFMEYSCDSPLEPRWFLRTDLSNNSKIAPAKYNGSYFADSRA